MNPDKTLLPATKKGCLRYKRPIFILLFAAALILAGCRTPGGHRAIVDQEARRMIAEKQEQLLANKADFTIEKPRDTFRRQLVEHLSLQVSGPASLGTDRLPPAAHWPEAGYPPAGVPGESRFDFADGPLTLSLGQALEIGAKNSFDYQARKEAVFQSAMALYLEQDSFRNSLAGQVQALFRSDRSTDPAVNGSLAGGKLSASRSFETGMSLTTSLAVDLARLLTAGGSSSVGIAGDASLSVPLLRGSGRHIVTEPLQQAEQNLIYAILDFERFRQELSVTIGSGYLMNLRYLDMVKNAEEDYQSRTISARRSQRLADAGRLKEIEVDQAVQTELVARQRWISARGQYQKQMDGFKTLLGIPPEADIRLDGRALRDLEAIPGMPIAPDARPGDLPPDLFSGPDTGHAGPLEIDEHRAIELALDHRLDLKIALGRVSDTQRAVVVAADALKAELTLLGSASVGERRTISGADLENARLRADKGIFSALFTLDLPFDRTAEAVGYRNSLIRFEQAVRNVQRLEDTVKSDVRNRLRELLEARESLYIQTRAVSLAQKRVRSITLFMDAGRAQTRDLLEAQDALLSAQNSLTAARVNYRIAELEIQRDMGVLSVTDTGLWQEFSPEVFSHDEK